MNDLVGLAELKKNMNDIVLHGDVYAKGGAHPPNFVINLASGNGQTTASTFITETFFNNRIRKFGGLDSLLEYRLDGSYTQLVHIFEEIDGSAVYTNSFEGVVAFDISGLAPHINEYQSEYFVERVKRLSSSATLIIFYDEGIKRIDSLKERISNSVGKCVQICVSDYSETEYAQIMLSNLQGRGFLVENEKTLIPMFMSIIESEDIRNAKDVVELADRVLVYADYHWPIPRISPQMIEWKGEKRL